MTEPCPDTTASPPPTQSPTSPTTRVYRFVAKRTSERAVAMVKAGASIRVTIRLSLMLRRDTVAVVLRVLLLPVAAMRSFRVFYDDCLRSRPLVTKCVTSGILFGVGDRLAQHIERRNDATIDNEQALDNSNDDSVFVDYEAQERAQRDATHQSALRTARMMVWGGLGFAPIAHTWYNLIERVAPGSAATAVVKKIALDQVFFAPAISTTFYTATQSLEGKSLTDALAVAKEKVPPTLRVNYLVWPLVHLFTFNFVPLQYRILYINFVSIGWSTFLSQMTNAKAVPVLATPAVLTLDESEQ